MMFLFDFTYYFWLYIRLFEMGFAQQLHEIINRLPDSRYVLHANTEPEPLLSVISRDNLAFFSVLSSINFANSQHSIPFYFLSLVLC